MQGMVQALRSLPKAKPPEPDNLVNLQVAHCIDNARGELTFQPSAAKIAQPEIRPASGQ